MSGYLKGARQDAKSARVESRSDIISYGAPVALRPGRVTELQAAGAVQVTMLDDAGGDSAPIDHVHTIPAASHTVGDIVWLVFWDGNPLPVIIATGSGDGGSCGMGYYQGRNDFGFAGLME